LESFKADFFEEAEVVGRSPSPFLIMVADVFFIVATPPTTSLPIGTNHKTIFRGIHT
jgi:hypothetical protein